MARKSNKTAHVLNLLSGQDTGDEAEKEPESAKEPGKTESAETEPKKAEPAPAEVQSAPVHEVPSNISIIDNGSKEDDPIAEQIRDELLKELGEEPSPSASAPVTEPEPAASAATTAAEPEPASAIASAVAAPEATDTPVSDASKAAPSVTPAAAPPKPADTPASDTEAAASQSAPEKPAEEILELTPEPEPPAEPEPDYVMLNVMQRVVEDKIIYFMKQFEVCTCDRCRADTIALTLSGLPSKYRIVDKHAVDPLVSYYTGRLISQVTVEALKACTQVKDNPRH